LWLAHIRITRIANVQSELIFYDGAEPNAFAAMVNGQRTIAINTAMIKLIGDDINEFAALLGQKPRTGPKDMRTGDQRDRVPSRQWVRSWALGIDYMVANSFDPEGAVRLHEKMLKLTERFRIPFLSSHPSSEERIENLEKLIQQKQSASR
jgi:Zn-dependent protease with chaperone function